MRFRKVYVEISNLCNLSCSFCPGTKRPVRRMTVAEFESLMPKLRPYTDYLYFHLMGEPLCHPHLQTFLEIAHRCGFRVILTTNGTLLKKMQDVLLAAKALHKINISLHAFEANDLQVPFGDYLDACFRFGEAVNGERIVVYRLWNHGGQESFNAQILHRMKDYFPEPWAQERSGIRIGQRVYLENADRFQWPDLSAEVEDAPVFCYGLKDQIGVLCDGTVVPCCLDHEGDIPLGNLFSQDLDAILASPRAQKLYRGFQCGKAEEPLCQHCDYARRFSR